MKPLWVIIGLLMRCRLVLWTQQNSDPPPTPLSKNHRLPHPAKGGGPSTPTSVRLGPVRVQAGAQAVGANPLPLASGLQLGELPLQVPPLSFQDLHLVLTPPVRLLQFLKRARRETCKRNPFKQGRECGLDGSPGGGPDSAEWGRSGGNDSLLSRAIMMSNKAPFSLLWSQLTCLPAWGRSSKSWLSWSALMQPSLLYPGLEAAIRTGGHGATDWAIDLQPGRPAGQRAAALPPEPQLAQLLSTQLIKHTQKRCHMELKPSWHWRASYPLWMGWQRPRYHRNLVKPLQIK